MLICAKSWSMPWPQMSEGSEGHAIERLSCWRCFWKDLGIYGKHWVETCLEQSARASEQVQELLAGLSKSGVLKSRKKSRFKPDYCQGCIMPLGTHRLSVARPHRKLGN